MKTLRLVSAICLMFIMISSCDEDQIIPGTGISDEFLLADAKKAANANKESFKVTGSVELFWKGKDKGSNAGNKPEELLTFMDITAFEATDDKESKGEIVFTVLETDYSPHREIIANVQDVFIDPDLKKAWLIALVISDSKGCAGNGNSGHDDACGGSDDHSSHDGGCSHDEPDDGGCSHDEPDDGGCSHDEPDDGGCSHDEPDDGGCSGSDAGPDIHGGSPGGEDKGNPLSGKNCRMGQLIVLKTHDGGTPGRSNDGITWKWFNQEGAPDIQNISAWPHLCKKEIIEGNIVIHTR